MQFLLMVQITGTGSQEDIVYVGRYLLHKRSVAMYAQLLIGTIVAYHIDKTLGQFVAVLLIYPSLHRVNDLRTFKRHDVVPSTGISSAGAEEASVMQTLEGHAKVVSTTVHGYLQILYLPVACHSIAFGLEDIQTTHTYVSVAGEVKLSVGTEGRKHLIAFCVDRLAYVLNTS